MLIYITKGKVISSEMGELKINRIFVEDRNEFEKKSKFFILLNK